MDAPAFFITGEPKLNQVFPHLRVHQHMQKVVLEQTKNDTPRNFFESRSPAALFKTFSISNLFAISTIDSSRHRHPHSSPSTSTTRNLTPQGTNRPMQCRRGTFNPRLHYQTQWKHPFAVAPRQKCPWPAQSRSIQPRRLNDA